MTCRSPDEAYAAGARAAADLPPLTEEQAVTVALLLAPARAERSAA